MYIKLLIKVGKDTLLPGILPSVQSPAPTFSSPFLSKNGNPRKGISHAELKGAPTVISVNNAFKAGFPLPPASSFGYGVGLEHLQQWETYTIHILKGYPV